MKLSQKDLEALPFKDFINDCFNFLYEASLFSFYRHQHKDYQTIRRIFACMLSSFGSCAGPIDIISLIGNLVNNHEVLDFSSKGGSMF